MPTMDVFNADAFSMNSLTRGINNEPYVPQFLGGLGIFDVEPVATETVQVENRNNTISLIPTTPRGSEPSNRTEELRQIRNVNTVRIAQKDRITASQVQNMRAFGSESELATVQGEWARRTARLQRNISLTWENMRLGAVQGIVTDQDGSTIIDWYDFWGVSQPTELDFELDDATTDVRGKCAAVTRATVRAGGGSVMPATRIYGLAGDTFWDDLVSHAMVRDTYLYQQGAALREQSAFGMLDYGGITFVNYRGTDDTSTVAVGATKCKFFPVGAVDMFGVAFSPGESFDVVNTLGLPLYNMAVMDRDRNSWVQSEVYSYPLFMCYKPLALQRAKNA